MTETALDVRLDFPVLRRNGRPFVRLPQLPSLHSSRSKAGHNFRRNSALRELVRDFLIFSLYRHRSIY